jgi:hypothetical protein
MQNLPKLRTDIQITPILIRGQQTFAVKDMIGLIKDNLVIAPEIASVMAFFDGEHTVRDLQMVLMRQRGNQLIMADEIEHIIGELDELCLLQTERYQEKKNAHKSSFIKLDHRPAAFAGSAYPDTREGLQRMVQEAIESAPNRSGLDAGHICGLVAPHIDIKAGRNIYAQAYAALDGCKPSRLIVLGTGHAIEEGIISLTTKDYLTPVGSFPTDTAAVKLLKEAGGTLVSPDDFAHSAEHSVEFQIVFLRALLKEDIPIVPILVGSFDVFLNTVDRLSEVPEASPFLAALTSLAGENSLVIAGVDLSHVGLKFGHPHPAAYYEPEFSAHDRTLLDAVCAGSAQAFWAEGKRVEDRYHVCGFPVLATLLEILPEAKGKVLDYQIWHDNQTRSAVSFAALVLARS